MIRKFVNPITGLGLLALALAGTMVFAAKPQLRVGMNREEVDRLIGSPLEPLLSGGLVGGVIFTFPLPYFPEPDWLGNRAIYLVSFDSDGLVTKWEVRHEPRVRPPWLERAMKAVGW